MGGEQSGGIGTITGEHIVALTDPRGNVSVHIGLPGASDPTPKAPRRPLPRDIIRGLARVFVEPPGYDLIERALSGASAVTVCGPRGAGRRTAAVMALGRCGEADHGFRELPDDSVDGTLRCDPGAVEAGERLLLDLTADTPPLSDRVWADLRSYRAVVAERGAYLAIVLPGHMRQAAAEIGAPTVDIGRPNGAAVLSAHLAEVGVPVPAAALREPELARRLDQEPMHELAALAERVDRVRMRMAGEGDWPAWLAPALDAAEAHLEAVAQRVDETPDGGTRMLLLSAAVFEDAAPEVVALATTALRTAVGYPPDDTHRLDRPDLAASLRPLGAGIRGRAVRFDSLTYAEAVRTHFWTTFPDLRPELRSWLDGFLRQPTANADRVRVALRFTEQCLATDHPEDVRALAEGWAGQSRLAEAATAALRRGLDDDRHGRWFRQQVYAWAVQPSLHPDLAIMLIGLCAEVIAPVRPHQALVRLRHLARHTTTAVADAAVATLADLAARDGHFARRLLWRVHEDLTGPNPRQGDLELFLVVAEPERLVGQSRPHPVLAERGTRARVTECWSHLVACLPLPEITVAVSPWLTAHAALPQRTVLLDCLAEAARGRPALVARLYGATRDWVDRAPDPDIRTARLRTAARLRQSCIDFEGETQ